MCNSDWNNQIMFSERKECLKLNSCRCIVCDREMTLVFKLLAVGLWVYELDWIERTFPTERKYSCEVV